MKKKIYWLLFCFLSLPILATPPLLKDGDTVVLLGGTLIERDAHECYLEMALTLANADKDIRFRNLGWSGDTVKGESRGYFSPDGYKDLLKKVTEAKPTVIVLAYGANAAWQGPAGVKSFAADYKKLVGDLEAKTKARFIFLTPLRHEKLPAPYPDPKKFNADLAAYSEVVKNLATSKKQALVDLYGQFSMEDKNQLTTNGIHLNDYGYWRLAKFIAREFGYKDAPESKEVVDVSSTGKSSFKLRHRGLSFPPSPLDGSGGLKLSLRGLPQGKYTLTVDGYKLATASAQAWASGVAVEDGLTAFVRQRMIEKNETYFHAWRPQNTTYLFFFRKHEQGRNATDIAEFLRHHAERENELLKVKKSTMVRYEIAPESDGSDEPTTKSTRQKFVMSVEEEKKTFKVPEDLEVSLFAAEPMVINPTNMNWDRQGRLWVACSPTYPQIVPGHLADDYIVVLEDTDKDGQADKRTVFVDGLLIPTAVIPGNGGVYVANSTELVHYKDTDGDGKADQKKVILSGFGTEDTHHILHTPYWGQDGLLYLNQSIYIHSHVETVYGVKRLMAGGIWQYDPHTEKLEVFSYGLVNSWGHQMDKWGQSFATDGAGSQGINYVFPDIYQRTAFRARHILSGLNPGQPKHCGLEIISGSHFPAKYQGLFLTNDFRGHRTNVFRVSEAGSGYSSKQQADFISTGGTGIDRTGKGGSFRPVDVKMGPDGAVYLADWSNIIIQHGEVDFRDERRDQVHGRIWRVSAKGRPFDKMPVIKDQPVETLLNLISANQRLVTDMVKRELIERGGQEILPALKKWTATLGQGKSADYLRLQSLWLQQAVNTCDEALLSQLLKSEEGRIRAAAVRVVRYFKDRLPQALEWMKTSIQDTHPQVRLEALNALRALNSTAAVEVSMKVLDQEMDLFLDYSLTLTLKKCLDAWAGQTTFGGDTAAIAYAIKATKNTQALSLLFKAYQDGQISSDKEAEVLSTLASLGGQNELKVLLELASAPKTTSTTQLTILRAMNSASHKKNRPADHVRSLKTLLQSGNENVVAEAAQLAGNWQVAALMTDLGQLTSASSPKVAVAALRGIAGMGGQDAAEILVRIVKSARQEDLRTQALRALVEVDLDKAAALAVRTFQSLSKEAEVAPAFDGFIRKKGGSQKLVKALQGKTIPPFIAEVGVRQVNVSGQQLGDLIAALSTAGGLKPMKQQLSAQEMRALTKAVNERGNPVIGEQIYRRKALACVNCHAIGGAGVEVGPDLLSLGASAPVDYIVESILQPTKKIKEGYHMTVVSTKDGQTFAGTEVSAGSAEVVIRDAAGQKHVIATTKVQSRQIVPMSMMPPGLTASLTSEEFIHLISFLAELGKDGPFKLSTASYLRTLKVTPTTSGLIKSLTDRRPSFLKSFNDLPWQKGYAKVNGYIPLNDGSVIDNAREAVLTRFDVKVTAKGKIALKVSDRSRISLRDSSGAPLTIQKDNVVYMDYDKGEHPVFMVVQPSTKVDKIRIELVELEGSKGRAEFTN